MYNIIFFRSIERIEILELRMTGAAFDFANLPMVTIVEISSDAFDRRTPCKLIRSNWQPVTVVLGDQKGLCVSVILLNQNKLASELVNMKEILKGGKHIFW